MEPCIISNICYAHEHTHLYIQSPFQTVIGRQVGRQPTQDTADLTVVLQVQLQQKLSHTQTKCNELSKPTDCIKSNNAQIMSDKLNGFKITCRRIWLSSSLNPKTSTESRKSTSDICIHKHIYRRNSDTGASDTFSIVIHKFIYFWFLLFTKGNHSLNVLFSLYTRVQLWLKFSLTSKRTISVPVLR